MALAGLLNNKVDGSLGSLRRHDGTAAAIAAGGGEAVLTAQVAVMGYVQTERLDGGVLHHRPLGVDVVLLLEQQLLLRQLLQLLPALLQLCSGVLGQFFNHVLRTVLRHGGRDTVEQIVAQFVQHMDGAAVHVHGDAAAQSFKCMDHSYPSFVSFYGQTAHAVIGVGKRQKKTSSTC